MRQLLAEVTWKGNKEIYLLFWWELDHRWGFSKFRATRVPQTKSQCKVNIGLSKCFCCPHIANILVNACLRNWINSWLPHRSLALPPPLLNIWQSEHVFCPLRIFCVCSVSEAEGSILQIYCPVGQLIVNPAPVITLRHNPRCARPVVKKYFLTPKLEHLRLSTKIPLQLHRELK